ncbi:glycosyltransferase [Candidatus Woesearchaeota archaeon]|nr:glycosyltransferase [Candidatus Woesearchaeota archaeon]
MKVLFNCNNTVFQVPGGGEILLLKTKEYLEKAGIKVKLFDQWHDKMIDYDIMHNFGKTDNSYDFIKLSKMYNLPVVLTPIYNWPALSYGLNEHFLTPQKIKNIGYTLLKKHFPMVSKSKKIMMMTDLITPDSMIEGRLLCKDFGFPIRKIHPVPCGVDERFYKAKPDEFIDKYKLQDFVLFVGKIEPRKNILSLIRIMNKIKVPLVIIGSKTQDNLTYYENCVKIAKKNIYFLGNMDHGSSMLESAYAAAKVLVMPSWYETPSLVGLEAGLAGANIVITRRGSTMDYYNKYALYVNPRSNLDIEMKIRKALDKDKNKDLSLHIKKNFLWSRVIERLIIGYKKVI